MSSVILDLTNYMETADRLRSVLAGGFHVNHLRKDCQLKTGKKGADPIVAWENHGHAEIHVHSTYGVHMLAQGDRLEFLSDRDDDTIADRLRIDRVWIWLFR